MIKISNEIKGYDEWKTTPPDSVVINYCVECLGEIYKGDYELSEVIDGIIHNDCWDSYAKNTLKRKAYVVGDEICWGD